MDGLVCLCHTRERRAKPKEKVPCRRVFAGREKERKNEKKRRIKRIIRRDYWASKPVAVYG